MEKSSSTEVNPGETRAVINVRSCTECSRRKVRCDRYLPCANCVRARSECVFPTSRRPPTRPKHPKGRSEEVLTYLRRLEKRLDARAREESEAIAQVDEASETPGIPSAAPTRKDGVSPTTSSQDASIPDRTADQDEYARLAVDHRRSRYISNKFWSGMAREIEEMRDILDESSSERDSEDEQALQQNGDAGISPATNHDSFMFSQTLAADTLHSFHPSEAHLLSMFDVFLENVDPVVRIFHRATLRSIVQNALPRLHDLDRSTEVVLFSLYHAALTSLSDFDCRRLFEEDRDVLLGRYRFAVEQSLAKARFLHSPNPAVLSALVLFLICVRRYDNSLFVSSLLGVVIRHAQNMGLHRDGTNFKLPPYQVEMRRRLWWHICVLDIRASEDHGSDPSILPCIYDTKFPSNINDDDISPDDVNPPPERPGASDMTFCLLRFEVCVAIRRLNYSAPGGDGQPIMSAADKHSMVNALEKHFEERYIRHCDITKPFEWVSATWAKMMLTKMWLAVHSPSPGLQGTTSPDVPADVRNMALEKSMEVLEISDLLETAPRASRWAWLFLTHVQWHAVVFVLAYLCVCPDAPSSRRAWLVIDKVYQRWSSTIQARKGMLWKPVRQLMHRANRVRNSTGRKASPPDSNVLATPWSERQAMASSPIDANISASSSGNFQPAGHASRGTDLREVYASTFSTSEAFGQAAGFNNASQSLISSPHAAYEQSTRGTLTKDPLQLSGVQSHDRATIDSGVSDMNGGLSVAAEPPNTGDVWSDWDNVMHGFQLDFQHGPTESGAEASKEVQNSIWNLWNTL